MRESFRGSPPAPGHGQRNGRKKTQKTQRQKLREEPSRLGARLGGHGARLRAAWAPIRSECRPLPVRGDGPSQAQQCAIFTDASRPGEHPAGKQSRRGRARDPWIPCAARGPGGGWGCSQGRSGRGWSGPTGRRETGETGRSGPTGRRDRSRGGRRSRGGGRRARMLAGPGPGLARPNRAGTRPGPGLSRSPYGASAHIPPPGAYPDVATPKPARSNPAGAEQGRAARPTGRALAFPHRGPTQT